MSREHDLKTWHEFFQALWDEKKLFEVRKNDRGFRTGDILHLREWNPDSGKYTGRCLDRRVTFVLGEQFAGIANGYCVLSLGPVEDRRTPDASREKGLKDLDAQIAVQTSNGNWNYDPYMHGLANGLILAKHNVTGAEGTPPFLEAPERWLSDRAESKASREAEQLYKAAKMIYTSLVPFSGTITSIPIPGIKSRLRVVEGHCFYTIDALRDALFESIKNYEASRAAPAQKPEPNPIWEIIGTDGTVHYRRPWGDPLLDEGRRTTGYWIRCHRHEAKDCAECQPKPEPCPDPEAHEKGDLLFPCDHKPKPEGSAQKPEPSCIRDGVHHPPPFCEGHGPCEYQWPKPEGGAR